MIWLFGYELRDTILFFTQKDIFVIATKKKTDFLRPLRYAIRPSPTLFLIIIQILCSFNYPNS